MKKANGFINKKDFLIICLVAMAAFLSCLPLFFMTEDAGSAVVSDGNAELFSIGLSQIDKGTTIQKEFATPKGRIVFEFVPQEGVRAVSSDCPDKVCIKAGFIRKSGQMIVCLPLKIYAEIKSGQEGDSDAIVR